MNVKIPFISSHHHNNWSYSKAPNLNSKIGPYSLVESVVFLWGLVDGSLVPTEPRCVVSGFHNSSRHELQSQMGPAL